MTNKLATSIELSAVRLDPQSSRELLERAEFALHWKLNPRTLAKIPAASELKFHEALG